MSGTLWQSTAYTIPTLIASIVSLGLALFARRRRIISHMAPFAALAAAVSLWTFGYAWELVSVPLAAKVWFAKIEYVGIVTPPVAWAAYALHYIGRSSLVTRRRVLLAMIVPSITVLLVWTNEWHGLIWARTGIATYNGWAMLDVTYGPWFWVHTVYSYVFLAIGTLLLLQALVLSSALYQNQIAVIIISALAPWIANALYISGSSPFPYLDLTPFGFTISAVAMAWGLLRLHLFTVVPVARHLIVDSLSEGVVVLDSQGRVTDINPAAAAMLGVPADAPLGKPAAVALAPLGIDPLPAATQKVPAEGSFDATLAVGGETRNLSVTLSGLRNWRDHQIGRVLMLRDVTAQKRIELQLQRQALAFENLHDSVIVSDVSGLIIEANPASEALFGYSKDELIGRSTSFASLDPADPTLPGQILQGLRGEGRWQGEFPIRRKDGSTGVCSLVVVPLKASEETIGYIGVARDITASKAVEASLLAQRNLFANLVAIAKASSEHPNLDDTLENTLEIVVELTSAEQGSIVLLDESQVVTNSILVRDQATRTERQNLVGRVMSHGLAGWLMSHKELALIDDTASDPRWARLPDTPYDPRSVLALPIQDPGQDEVIGLLLLLHTNPFHFAEEHVHLMQAAVAQISLAIRNARLLNDQQRIAQELGRAKEAAERASEAKSQFLSNISHELRTPLTAIIGFSDMLHEDLTEADLRRYLPDVQKIRGAGNQLLTLINDVLDLARLEAGRASIHWESASSIDLVSEAILAVQPLAEQNRNTLVYDQAVDYALRTDRGKLVKILRNLLGNAVKFTKDGTVRLAVEPAEGDRLRFVISDTGIGMTPSHIADLFQTFSQADASTTRRFGGAGMGLAISRNLCRLLGGEIEVESVPGQGSIFTVTLPLNPASHQAGGADV